MRNLMKKNTIFYDVLKVLMKFYNATEFYDVKCFDSKITTL